MTEVTSRTTKVLVSTIVAVWTFSSVSWRTEVLLPWRRAPVKNSRSGGQQPEKLGCRQLTVWRMAQPSDWWLVTAEPGDWEGQRQRWAAPGTAARRHEELCTSAQQSCSLSAPTVTNRHCFYSVIFSVFNVTIVTRYCTLFYTVISVH